MGPEGVRGERGARESTRVQFARFVLAGLVNTLFGYCVFALLVFIGMGAFGALVIATVSGVAFNFQTISRLVFRRLDVRLGLRFVMVYVAAFVLNWAGLKALMTVGTSEYLAQAVLTPFVAVMSFVGHKVLVFEAGAWRD